MKKFLLLFGTSCIITATFVFIYITKYDSVAIYEGQMVSAMFQMRGQKPASEMIEIIDIDDKSLHTLGQWPWSRNKIAKIVDNLVASGVGIIGFDIVFASKDNSSPKKIIQDLKLDVTYLEQMMQTLSGKSAKILDYDEEFGKSLQKAPAILGYIFNFDNKFTLNNHTPQNKAIIVQKYVNNVQKGIPYSLDAKDAVLNTPIVQRSAYSSGFLNTFPDKDGIVRSIPLIIKYQDVIYPSLALEMIRAISGVKKISITYNSLGVDNIQVGNIKIPTDRLGRMIINYAGAQHSYKYISALDIYNNNFNKEDIKGKIVLIGTSAPGLMDLRSTPFDEAYPGVEVHANALDNIINSNFISSPSYKEGIDIVSIVLGSLLVAFVLYFFRPSIALVLSVALVVGFVYLDYYLLFYKGIMLGGNITLTSMSFIILYSFGMNYFIESKQKTFIKEKFANKVSADVVDDLLTNKNAKMLEPKQELISIFFSDIRGFTTISETFKEPKDLIDFLNLYMNPMVEVILKQKGVVDKFIGDAIMAYWNAPNKIKNHQDKALSCALEQIILLKELNEVFKKTQKPQIKIGIGLHSGIATIGEMGSDGRSDYTIIGDNVNLASRIEGLTKFYGAQILISNDFKQELRGKYYFRHCDRVRVKGKNEAVELYEVFITKSEYDEYEKTQKAKYEKAVELYYLAKFSEAKRIFTKLNKDNPHILYEMYANRCATLIKTPPKMPFNGIYTATSK